MNLGSLNPEPRSQSLRYGCSTHILPSAEPSSKEHSGMCVKKLGTQFSIWNAPSVSPALHNCTLHCFLILSLWCCLYLTPPALISKYLPLAPNFGFTFQLSAYSWWAGLNDSYFLLNTAHPVSTSNQLSRFTVFTSSVFFASFTSFRGSALVVTMNSIVFEKNYYLVSWF